MVFQIGIFLVGCSLGCCFGFILAAMLGANGGDTS